MLTSVSTDTIVTTMEILNRQAVLIEVLIAVAVFGLAILIANLLERPFEKLTRAIRERKEGYTDAPIEVYDYLETEHICDAFNSLQSRMKVLDDSRDEFVSNVSHELKTPITSMKVLADSLLAMKEKYGVEDDGMTLCLNTSREDLANTSGMTTNNAIRTLSAFASEKVVELDGKKIKILNEKLLQLIASKG